MFFIFFILLWNWLNYTSPNLLTTTFLFNFFIEVFFYFTQMNWIHSLLFPATCLLSSFVINIGCPRLLLYNNCFLYHFTCVVIQLLNQVITYLFDFFLTFYNFFAQIYVLIEKLLSLMRFNMCSNLMCFCPLIFYVGKCFHL